ncbi:MAG TPA: L,D-transpeptidase [Beijerinckiaceae bacterium]|nr:L,D-transpeptidase [Beijerinckiaceae bacterium]HVB89984.1 L,D-transpeptidase [Beijerinckiaceae bacterium]
MLANRRAVLSGASAFAVLGLAGCNASREASTVQIAAASPVGPQPASAADAVDSYSPGSFSAMYGPIKDEPFPIPGVRRSDVDPAFLRKLIDYPTSESAGTIVVDPHHHYLYHVMDGGKAMRYGVGVGRAGFAWSGVAKIHNKQRWPDWYPPQDMFERQPDIKKLMSHLQSGLGMPGGPNNPLGARAMYLWQGEKDTLYRIHGTTEPRSIGKSMSSGCIRMLDQDVIDLYGRTPVGTKVIVL